MLTIQRLLLVTLLIAGAVASAFGQNPIVQYSFPASWDGTAGNPVVDLSPAGNDGFAHTGAALSATIPPGATGGTMSLDPTVAGVGTNAIDLLANSVVEASGGFQYHVTFMWDGTDNDFTVQKILDYAGTESLQLNQIDSGLGEATLFFQFDDDDTNSVSAPIQANTWYEVTATFDTLGNSVVGGNLDGMATLVLNNGTPITGAVTMTSQGDDLNRPIAVGALGFPNNANLVNFSGPIYDPTVSLLPEPGSLVLLSLGGLTLLRRRRRRT